MRAEPLQAGVGTAAIVLAASSSAPADDLVEYTVDRSNDTISDTLSDRLDDAERGSKISIA